MATPLDLIWDAQAIGAMTDNDWTQFWEALGTVVRIACKAAQPPKPAPPEAPSRDPAGTTTCGTERRWTAQNGAPASARAFGLGR